MGSSFGICCWYRSLFFNDIHSIDIHRQLMKLSHLWCCMIGKCRFDDVYYALQESLKFYSVLILLEYCCLILTSFCMDYQFLKNHIRKLVKENIDILSLKFCAGIVFLLRYSRIHSLGS